MIVSELISLLQDRPQDERVCVPVLGEVDVIEVKGHTILNKYDQDFDERVTLILYK